MDKIFRKALSFTWKIPLIVKSLRKIYRYGGYSTIHITSINRGHILKDKKVLITGGGSGIGLSIAKKCLQEGASVVITGRDEGKLNRVKNEINNPRLNILVWDISQIPLTKGKILLTEELLKGSVDILINNTGIVNGVNFLYVTEEIWDEIYSTNSKGLFFLTQSITKKWISEQNFRLKKIINISSQGGFVGATYPYRMTKWDIAGLTQGLGLKLAPFGIIVNGIAPGIVATSMQPDILKQKENFYCNQNPLERYALPEEIAELAIFLMSDASNFIVGQTIVCDGGFSLK